MTQNEEVIQMDVEALVSTVVVVTTILGSRAMLRKEINEVRLDVKADLRRFDDRVYQLASGLKPLVDQAERKS